MLSLERMSRHRPGPLVAAAVSSTGGTLRALVLCLCSCCRGRGAHVQEKLRLEGAIVEGSILKRHARSGEPCGACSQNVSWKSNPGRRRLATQKKSVKELALGWALEQIGSCEEVPCSVPSQCWCAQCDHDSVIVASSCHSGRTAA